MFDRKMKMMNMFECSSGSSSNNNGSIENKIKVGDIVRIILPERKDGEILTYVEYQGWIGLIGEVIKENRLNSFRVSFSDEYKEDIFYPEEIEKVEDKKIRFLYRMNGSGCLRKEIRDE